MTFQDINNATSERDRYLPLYIQINGVQQAVVDTVTFTNEHGRSIYIVSADDDSKIKEAV